MQKLSIALLLSVLLFASCNRNKKSTEEEIPVFSEEIAKVVSYVTVGNIKSQQPIEVGFIDPVVEYEALNKDLGSDIISLDPEIEGTLKWTDTQTLTFVPEGQWKLRQRYAVAVDLNKLSHEFLEDDLGEIKFGFYVEGREIAEFKAEPKLKQSNDPRVINYVGRVVFTEATDEETVANSISLKQGLKSLDVKITPESDGISFGFESEDIIRDDKSRAYTFIIDKAKLELSEDYRDDFDIPAIEDMKVSKIIEDEDGRKPRIRIVFSDDLDGAQNLDGFINIDPAVDFKYSKMGKSVLLDGDFKFGEAYTIEVAEGVRSRWATVMDKKSKFNVRFSDLPPQLEFTSDGYLLPSSNKQKLQFMSANLKRVHLEIKKVYHSDLERFVQNEQLQSDKKRSSDFLQSSYYGAAGVIVHNQTLELGDTKNEWLLSEFDLSGIFDEFREGLYLLQVNFNPGDVMVEPHGDDIDYVRDNGQIYKPLVISDLGLTLKVTDNEVYAITTDLITSRPRGGVSIELRSFYGDSYRASGNTSNDGILRMRKPSYFHYAIATDESGMTILKLDESEWNTSGFNISGVSENSRGTRAFIYTERGVYRPGDEINLSVILRDKSNSYPDNTPASLGVYNPQGQLVHSEIINQAQDGFYSFGFSTDESAPTGNWQARIEAGNNVFYHNLKIETVVPFKLKVRLETDKDKIYASDDYLKVDIISSYLFGTPAKGLKAEAEVEFVPRNVSFPKYESFSFTNDYAQFNSITRNIYKGTLDTSGNASITYRLPDFENVPSALVAKVNATVFEKGGRPNNGWLYLPVETYPVYVGIKKSDYGYHYVQTNSETSIPVIVLNDEGIPAEGQKIQYSIYQNNSSWWWHYDNRGEYRKRFKSNSSTTLVKEGQLTSAKGAVNLKFKPEERGDYLIEVQVGGVGGHKVATFMYAYPWGEIPSGDQNEGTLSLRSDKGKYNVGETAKIICPMPLEGSALLTVERGDEILKSEWLENNGKGEVVYSLPITAGMVPSSYVSVSVIQPHAQSVNDRPIRMFGILPLQVEDAKTRHGISIKMPEELEPNKKFNIEVSTDDGRPTQFTIAVVDEGLLDLTAFKTPDPWKFFFQKLRLQVRSYDIFKHVIGANQDDVFKTFSIGGDMDYREAELGVKKGKRRFKPVSLFAGPVNTDANGKATVSFTMPEYYGSVRVMVVSARDNSYAHEEKTVPVRTDLIVQSSVPRVLGPDEKFKLPVNVFAMKDGMGEVSVKVTVEGPLKLSGKKQMTVKFDKASDKDLTFDLGTLKQVGQAKIVVEASAGKASSRTTVDVMVQPRASRDYGKEEKELTAGSTVTLAVPKPGIEGTNRAQLNIALFANMDFTSRLSWLIHYPYGCIEQTTSSVFPQLYMKEIIPGEFIPEREIDENINAGIERLRLFHIPGNGFGYWPGDNRTSDWGTNYAGHFIIEARKLGYHVPEDMYSDVVSYLERKARYASGDLITRVNRVFILALAGKQSNDMNILQEKEMTKLNDVQKQMLATAFYLSGQKAAAAKIAREAGTEAKEYSPFSVSYGSHLRDMAIILYSFSLREETENARLLANEIARKLAEREWYSTQSVGYSLLALGNYFRSIGLENIADQHFVGEVKFADGSKKAFDSRDPVTMDMANAIGEEIQITLSTASSMTEAYASLSYDGVPLRETREPSNKNLELEVRWLDESGSDINPRSITQGTTIYGHYRVKNISPVSVLEEVALVQVLPSGWEIENIRLSGSELPSWTNSLKLNKEEYLDIRDDRIMWFFDMHGGNYDFLVKINAVTAGEFYMPGAKTEAMYSSDYEAVAQSMDVLVKPF